jgi:transcription initiation factor TFIIB
MTQKNKTTQQSGPETQQSTSESSVSCPECGGRIIPDEEHGEKTCEKCGLVINEELIDHGPEWRAFSMSERNNKSRVGAPTTELIHDKGLSTIIDWRDKDASGEAISSRKRAQMNRLRTWNTRFQTKDSHERNLKQANSELRRMASALGLPKPVQETAGVLYRRAVRNNLLPGRSIEGMATAALYAAARQHNTPRSLSEFETVSRVEQLRIQRAYRHLSRELNLEIEPADPVHYLPQFASELELSDEAIQQATELLSVAKDYGIHSGRSPPGLAASAIYAASRLTNEKRTQDHVSDIANVSTVTIRQRYKEILEVYAQEQG